MVAAQHSSRKGAKTAAHQDMPITPTPAHASLPAEKMPRSAEGPSLTPPPSSHIAPSHKLGNTTPTPSHSHLSSPPPSTVLRRTKAADVGDAPKVTKEQMESMSAEELRTLVNRMSNEVHDAKTMAAHYKLQHQMAQMESSEAVERMAVEMEMARREIEVLQQAEARLQYSEKMANADPTEDETQFRKIHVSIYSGMEDEIRDLKLERVHAQRELAHSRQVIEQQENEIASLNDKVLLMRERIKESRDQLLKYRRTGMLDSTPRTIRATPFQTPVREHFRPMQSSQDQYTPSARPRHARPEQEQQEGFAALLQATDIVSQARQVPNEQQRGHSRNVHSLSSLPTTPSRSVPRPIQPALYTPQPPRQPQVEVPQTAPLPRKRAMERTPPPSRRRYESDGTVSAAEDSEAETEVDEDVHESRASVYARDLLRSPTAKRAKSAHNLKGMTQTKLFGPVTKANTPRSEVDRETKRAKVASSDVGLGIAGVRERQAQQSPV